MTFGDLSKLENELRTLSEQFDSLVQNEKHPETNLEVKKLHQRMTEIEKMLNSYAKKKQKSEKIAAVIDILEIRVAKLKDTKGINPGEKDHKRMKDIVTKSNGSSEKIIQLVMNMAKSIDDSDKARRRGEAALLNLPPEVADRAAKIFFARADYLAD